MGTAEAQDSLTVSPRFVAETWLRAHPGEFVYIAGPMTDQPGHGYATFNAAEAALWEWGVIPLNPARGGPTEDAVLQAKVRAGGNFRHSRLYASMMRKDIGLVILSRALFMLPDWERSTGATAEAQIGRLISNPLFDGGWLL